MRQIFCGSVPSPWGRTGGVIFLRGIGRFLAFLFSEATKGSKTAFSAHFSATRYKLGSHDETKLGLTVLKQHFILLWLFLV
ncbi:hypothetical protein M2132_000865 [Dysgonomonas sp. PH5-45]|nr:hypothetical protein [Dysgonomonas sp. PH5-45]MDH6387407.1 hypothetical protein [Dysgonomonas sp. PH5-37]